MAEKLRYEIRLDKDDTVRCYDWNTLPEELRLSAESKLTEGSVINSYPSIEDVPDTYDGVYVMGWGETAHHDKPGALFYNIPRIWYGYDTVRDIKSGKVRSPWAKKSGKSQVKNKKV
jgi:hypothetical protein